MSPTCIILGAGPAGCSAALELASGGVRVTLIESRAFPRPKLCGEYISPAGLHSLHAIIDAHALHDLGARRVERFVLRVEDRRVEWVTPAAGLSLSRARLDESLAARAQARGVMLLQPVTVRKVTYHNTHVRVLTNDGACHDADIIVHADGWGRHDLSGATPTAAGIVGLKCHLRLPPGMIRGVSMLAAPGAYVGTIEVEAGLATCALCVRSERLREFDGDRDALIRHLWPEFRAEWRVGDWLAGGVARSGHVAPGHARSFRIGNAAGAVDPIGGEGIGLALWSGVTLGKLLTTGDSQADSGAFKDIPTNVEWSQKMLALIHERFARLYRSRLRIRRWACRIGAETLMRPALVRALWPLLARPGLALRPWYYLTGKPARAAMSP